MELEKIIYGIFVLLAFLICLGLFITFLTWLFGGFESYISSPQYKYSDYLTR